MLELGAGPIIFRTIGWLYWGLALAAVIAALWWPRDRSVKVGLALFVFAAFVTPVALREWSVRQQREERTAQLNAAMAHFDMRCKSAGEKITRTVENVDGIVWMRWRPKSQNLNDQFKLDDPYGYDCGGEECIKQLLRVTIGGELDPEKELLVHRGYTFVESVDPSDNVLYRYTLRLFRVGDRKPGASMQHFDVELIKEPISTLTAKYGVTWNDISTRDDRENWIAGGSLTVVDLSTQEIVAERVGYMVDRGQGNTGGSRSPWGFADNSACPQYLPIGPSDPRRSRRMENRDFVLKVASPTSGA